MNIFKLFSTPDVFSPDDLHLYRKAQLLNFWLLFGFVMLTRASIRSFIHIDDLVTFFEYLPLIIRLLWCVALAFAYYLFKVKHQIVVPAWISSLAVAFIVGQLALSNPVLAAPLVLLVPIVVFSLIDVFWGRIVYLAFAIYIIYMLLHSDPSIASHTPNAFIYNHIIALILGGGATYYLERGKMEVIDRLHNSATKDYLTQCWNRDVFLKSLDNQISKASRSKEAFCLVIFDIDHFKQINDTFGHQTGDDVLKEFVQIIQTNIRQVDQLARLGGEEFALLMPNTSSEKAKMVCNHILAKVRNHSFECGKQVTTSAGLAQYKNKLLTKDLLRNADIALYEAKRLGRDRLV